MNADRKLALSDGFPLPAGMKLRTRTFGANPVSALVRAPVGGDSSNPRHEFKIGWEDQQLGVTVLMREQEDGRLLATVFCAYAGLLDKAAVSVGLMGASPERMIRKTVPLNVPETSGCSGSADFGPLTSAVKELGPQLGVVVFLVM